MKIRIAISPVDAVALAEHLLQSADLWKDGPEIIFMLSAKDNQPPSQNTIPEFVCGIAGGSVVETQ